MRIRALLLCSATLTLPGCLERTRLNARCEWTAEAEHPAVPAHSHLATDAQIAEALGIRYGDAFRGKLGVDQRDQLRERCTDSLFRMIAATHRVPLEQVARAGDTPDIRFALAEVLPMGLLFGLAAWYAAGRIQDKYAADGPLPMAVATLYASVVVSGFLVVIGESWAWMVEMLRYRDLHLSFRAFRMFWGRHRLAEFLIAVPLFWIIALNRYRRGRRAAPLGTAF